MCTTVHGLHAQYRQLPTASNRAISNEVACFRRGGAKVCRPFYRTLSCLMVGLPIRAFVITFAASIVVVASAQVIIETQTMFIRHTATELQRRTAEKNGKI